MSKKLTLAQRRLIAKGAAISDQIAALKTELDAIKTKLVLSDGRYSAPDAELIIKTSTRVTLDSATVKGFLTPAQVIEASRESVSTSYRFKSIAAEVSLAA